MIYIPFIHKIKKKSISPPQQIPLFIEEVRPAPIKEEEIKPIIIKIDLF